MDPKQVLSEIQGMISPNKNAKQESFESNIQQVANKSNPASSRDQPADGKKFRDLTLKNVPYMGKQELDPESQKLLAKQVSAQNKKKKQEEAKRLKALMHKVQKQLDYHDLKWYDPSSYQAEK